MTIRVSALFHYPVKSCAGIAVTELSLDDWGAVDDRRWMLVRPDYTFITQREVGSLALIGAHVRKGGLHLTHARMESLDVPYPREDASRHLVTVWDDAALTQDAGDEAAEWCSRATGVACRLVHIAPDAERPLQHRYAGSVDPVGRHVALSDGAPLLILSEGSLATLNEHLAEKCLAPVGFDRFRPNVVLSGAGSHEEDTWHSIEINGITIGVGSLCARCVMTTIDQSVGIPASRLTGEPGGEPLRTLATYRKQGGGVMFGMNATNASPGVVRVGDEVVVRALR